MHEMILRAHTRASQRMYELTTEPERGDGPTDNAWIIAGGVAAAGVLVAAVAAAVQSRIGGIK